MGSVAGLVVAGGSGERMLASGEERPKPLVSVAGATVLERNVAALLAAGVTQVYVATSTNATGVGDFASEFCSRATEKAGATMTVIDEDPPLGHLGAAGAVDADELLVVHADNLTTIDLSAMVDQHRSTGAAMTIAVHREPFTMPFGSVELDGARVAAYDEKPTIEFTVCSAVSVLGPAALARLRPPRFVMLPVFVNELLRDGDPVSGFVHGTLWVDVNDRAARDRAEALVGENPERFPTFESLGLSESAAQ